MSKSGLLPVWNADACVPRVEVLQGRLSDAELALSLPDVVRGRARPPYDDPVTFFEATYLTRNLKDIIGYVFGRLSGSRADVNPIIMLDVGFGGGKTHTMVSLYYAAKHYSKVKSYLGDFKIPASLKIVSISGEEWGEKGIKRDDKPIKTLWGDLFYQLGKYDEFKALDEEKSAPSLDDINKALGDTPVLVLLDEIPTYLNLVSKTDKQMQDRTTHFIQRLVAAISSHDKAMLVVAIAEDVYREEAGYVRHEISEEAEKHLEDAKGHLRRKQTVFAPIEETDAVHILKQRIFKSINKDNATEVAEAYSKMYKGGMAVPDKFKKKEYQDELELSYPFHPELIKVLYERVATLDAFQRTRGALRLLNKVVRRVWKEKEADAFLISPYHVDLAESDVVNDLTQQLGEGKLRNAVEADIYRTGGGAVAQNLDEEVASHWGIPLHRRVANVIFLYSLASGKIMDRGIDSETLVAVTVTPSGEDFALKIRDIVIKRIQDGHYIDRRGEYLQFTREPNPLRVIDKEAKNVMDQDAIQIVRETLSALFSDSPDWVLVELFPSDPSKLEDAATIKLGILNPNLNHIAKSEHEPTKSAEMFLTHKDAQGKSLRKYRNDTFILLAEESSVQGLWQSARKLHAARMVARDPNAYSIPSDKREAIEGYLTQLEDNIYSNVRGAFSIFGFIHKNGVPKYVRMNQNGYASGRKGKEMFVYHLKDVFRRIVDESLDPGYIMDDIWPSGAPYVSTQVLYETFHSKPGCIIPCNEGVFSESVKKGVTEGLWVVKVGQNAFTQENPPKRVSVEGNVEIWKIEEYKPEGEKPKDSAKPKGGKKPGKTGPENPGFYSFPAANPESLAQDLQKLIKKYRISKINQIKLAVSGNPASLLQVRNLLKRLESEKEMQVMLSIDSNHYSSDGQILINIKTNRNGLSSTSFKSAMEAVPKIESQTFDCTVTIDKEWTPEELMEKIESLKGAGEDTPFSLEVTWPVGGQ